MRLKVLVTDAMASSSGRAFWRANRSGDRIRKHTQEGRFVSIQALIGHYLTLSKSDSQLSMLPVESMIMRMSIVALL